MIAEDTDLSKTEAQLLASGLIGMAQTTARRWLRDNDSISRAQAAKLVAGLSWRGISGFPLTHQS